MNRHLIHSFVLLQGFSNLVPRLTCGWKPGKGAVRRKVGLVMMHGFLCSEMALAAHRVVPVILVTSAVFALCVCQGMRNYNVN